MAKKKNTNVLEGYQCPECGSLGPFSIECTCLVKVYDSGTDLYGDTTWTDDSWTQCEECEHDGILDNFSIARQKREKALKKGK